MQTMIAEQLGLKVSTVANFFMNARRRSTEKYCDDSEPPAAAAASGPVPTSGITDTGTDWTPTSQLTSGATAGQTSIGNAQKITNCQLPSTI